MLCRWEKEAHPHTPCMCQQHKNNQDLQNQGQGSFVNDCISAAATPPAPRAASSHSSFVLAIFSLGGKELTVSSTGVGGEACASLQCTQLVPFHHTHSKHIQTLLLSVCVLLGVGWWWWRGWANLRGRLLCQTPAADGCVFEVHARRSGVALNSRRVFAESF